MNDSVHRVPDGVVSIIEALSYETSLSGGTVGATHLNCALSQESESLYAQSGRCSGAWYLHCDMGLHD